MSVVRDLRVLLRLTNFRRLLAVRLLSQCADGVYQVALATYAVFSPEKQPSPAAIASAMAVLLLPYSLVGPFAGVLLDRWQRRQVFLYGNLLRALLAGEVVEIDGAPHTTPHPIYTTDQDPGFPHPPAAGAAGGGRGNPRIRRQRRGETGAPLVRLLLL